MPYNILLMGASYGSLLASKMLFGGHTIHLVCLPAEADLIKRDDTKPCGQGRNYRVPNGGIVCQPVNQNQRGSGACFNIMNFCAVNGGELINL